MKNVHVTIEGYNDLDRFIIKNKWTIEYDTTWDKKEIKSIMNIIVKNQNDEVVLIKEFNGKITTSELDSEIYREILQITREQKLNTLLNG
jgi:hypothetical protein